MSSSNDAESQPSDVDTRPRIIYNVKDYPPIHLSLLFMFQQVTLALPAVLMTPVIITQIMGAGKEDDVELQKELLRLRATLISITVFSCGISTVFQVTFGIRLPMIQGSSYTFIPVLAIIVTSPKWEAIGQSVTNTSRPVWQHQLQEVAGSLMAATLVQIIIGLLGLIGILSRFIGPLSITPILVLITMGLMDTVAMNCSYHWGIAAMGALLVVVFSELLGVFNIPIPSWERGRGCGIIRVPLFNMLPLFLSLTLTWGLCGILTAADVFPTNRTDPAYMARTDSKLYLIDDAAWFSFPYPGRWGWPTISVAGFVGMFVATISSIIESVGDYHAAAAICELPPPPSHAINRGILFEGFGSMVAAILFAGHGTTSYSGNVASIGITRVGSRIVFQGAGVVLIATGIFGKIGAAFATIPEPVMGGLLMAQVSMILAVAISLLQKVHMHKSRNQLTLGLAIYAGVVVPRWIRANTHRINTGSLAADQVTIMLLGTELIFGGFVGFVLDAILPGTREERGMPQLDRIQSSDREALKADQADVYDCPGCFRCCSKPSVCRYIPFMPAFKQPEISCCRKKKEERPPTDPSDKISKATSADNTTKF